MKLVDFETFVRMPAGTIFAPYEPCVLLERLAVKTDGGEYAPAYCHFSYTFNGVMPLEPWIDGSYCTLWNVGDSEKANFKIYDGDNNDYTDYKMFLVFEEEDIDHMINVLQWAKGGCIGDCDCCD